MQVVETLLGCALLIWFGVGILNFWSYRGVIVLRPTQAPAPILPAPKVSIILAARNEEQRLSMALESLMKLDYPDYQIILVDDDSTDRTGAIADDWAKRPESGGRLKVIHNHELPPGWTGKVHALNLAAKTAAGEWILATDADVVFHPALLRLALGCALEQRVDLLSLIPEFEPGSFADKAVLPSFSLLLGTMYPLRLVNHPKFPRALAAGAFILMRREDLEVLGGYERLRSTVIEDLRVAELFKRNGRRICLASTRGLFRTRTYRSWRQLWEGLSRTAFEATGFSVIKILAGAVVGVTLSVLPALTVIARSWSDLRLDQSVTGDPALLLGFATWLLSGLVCLPIVLYFRASPLYALAVPIAAIFYAAASLHSAWRSVFGRGIAWKGRRYRSPREI